VLPSMSVKRKVTMPVGRSGMIRFHTCGPCQAIRLLLPAPQRTHGSTLRRLANGGDEHASGARLGDQEDLLCREWS
jgi:hypothetical protein